jgi:vanillate O-demethylase monooxygenase subunit
MFPKNAWYVACTPEEIDGRPLGRKICNEAIVFFRGAQGEVAAQEDFCPHRGAPLSLGSVVEGRLVCGYHGLELGCDGKPVAMPGQRVRGFPCNRVYPVVERHGFIWVWPGEAALADPERIPRLDWADSPHWTFGGGVYHIKCDYRLMIDNLMDLTHEKYVHSTSIGQKELDEALPSTRVEDGVVISRRTMENIQAPPFWQAALAGNGLDPQAACDRWQVCRYMPPSIVNIDVGVAYAGTGGIDAPPECRAAGIVVDLITPETETTIWYFWGLARNFKADDTALTASIRETQGKVFLEDVAMLEAQQANLSRCPERALLSLNTDQGGMRARRILEQMVADERTGNAAGQERDS